MLRRSQVFTVFTGVPNFVIGAATPIPGPVVVSTDAQGIAQVDVLLDPEIDLHRIRAELIDGAACGLCVDIGHDEFCALAVKLPREARSHLAKPLNCDGQIAGYVETQTVLDRSFEPHEHAERG